MYNHSHRSKWKKMDESKAVLILTLSSKRPFHRCLLKKGFWNSVTRVVSMKDAARYTNKYMRLYTPVTGYRRISCLIVSVTSPLTLMSVGWLVCRLFHRLTVIISGWDVTLPLSYRGTYLILYVIFCKLKLLVNGRS